MLDYRELGRLWGCRATTARNRVGAVVFKFLKAYRPDLTNDELWQAAVNQQVQERLRDLIEQVTISRGVKWPEGSNDVAECRKDSRTLRCRYCGQPGHNSLTCLQRISRG